MQRDYKTLAIAVVMQGLKVLKQKTKANSQRYEQERVKRWFLSKGKTSAIWFEAAGLDQQAVVEALKAKGLL